MTTINTRAGTAGTTVASASATPNGAHAADGATAAAFTDHLVQALAVRHDDPSPGRRPADLRDPDRRTRVDEGRAGDLRRGEREHGTRGTARDRRDDRIDDDRACGGAGEARVRTERSRRAERRVASACDGRDDLTPGAAMPQQPAVLATLDAAPAPAAGEQSAADVTVGATGSDTAASASSAAPSSAGAADGAALTAVPGLVEMVDDAVAQIDPPLASTSTLDATPAGDASMPATDPAAAAAAGDTATSDTTASGTSALSAAVDGSPTSVAPAGTRSSDTAPSNAAPVQAGTDDPSAAGTAATGAAAGEASSSATTTAAIGPEVTPSHDTTTPTIATTTGSSASSGSSGSSGSSASASAVDDATLAAVTGTGQAAGPVEQQAARTDPPTVAPSAPTASAPAAAGAGAGSSGPPTDAGDGNANGGDSGSNPTGQPVIGAGSAPAHADADDDAANDAAVAGGSLDETGETGRPTKPLIGRVDTRRLDVDLSDEGLGALRVQTSTQGGALHMTMQAADPQVREAIARQSFELRRDLESSGIQLGSFDIGAHDDRAHDQRAQGWRAAAVSSGTAEGRDDRSTGSNLTPVSPRPRPASAATGLDLKL